MRHKCHDDHEYGIRAKMAHAQIYQAIIMPFGRSQQSRLRPIDGRPTVYLSLSHKRIPTKMISTQTSAGFT